MGRPIISFFPQVICNHRECKIFNTKKAAPFLKQPFDSTLNLGLVTHSHTAAGATCGHRGFLLRNIGDQGFRGQDHGSD